MNRYDKGETKPPAGSTRRTLPKILLFVMGMPLLAMPFLDQVCGACSDFDDEAMAALNACPAATAALGEPIEQALLGFSCGNYEEEGARGGANWRRPVKGPLGRGTYHFVSEKRGGQWHLQEGYLTVGTQEIDITQCRLVEQGFGVEVARTLKATVRTATGPSPVAVGAPCAVRIGPGGGPFGCRVVVRCNNQALYGATPTSGYVECRVVALPDGAIGVVAQDPKFTAQDKDPSLDLREADQVLVLADQTRDGLWTATLTLGGVDPNAPAERPAERPAGAP